MARVESHDPFLETRAGVGELGELEPTAAEPHKPKAGVGGFPNKVKVFLAEEREMVSRQAKNN